MIALDLRAAAVDPWQRTFDAGHGAHVLAMARSEAGVRAIGARPGVAERGDPVPSVFTTVGLPQGRVELRVSGLEGRPRVDAPVSTAGVGASEGTIVLERSFAETLDIPVGATVAGRDPERAGRAPGRRHGHPVQPGELPLPAGRHMDDALDAGAHRSRTPALELDTALRLDDRPPRRRSPRRRWPPSRPTSGALLRGACSDGMILQTWQRMRRRRPSPTRTQQPSC